MIESEMTEEMQKHEYARIAERESFYFWNVGRREILREVLSRYLVQSRSLEILDLGCGPGGNFSVLAEFGSVTGLDVSPEALKFAGKYNFTKLVLGDGKNLPFKDNSYDLVTSLDVLEHLEDDQKVMQEAWRVLKPGGFFLVSVPAHPWLWSDHDEAMRHKRRYSQKEILSKLQKVGFDIMEKSHFVIIAVPINFFRKIKDRILQKVFSGKQRVVDTYDVEFSKAVNGLLLFWLRIEKFIIRFISLPLGTSMFVIAKKPCSVSQPRQYITGLGV